MATGAVTVVRQGVVGNLKYGIVNVVGSSSYTTTGDAIDLSAILGFTPQFVHVNSNKTTAPTVNAPRWVLDITAKKLQAFGTAGNALGLTESTAATDFSNTTINIFAVGQ